MRNFLPLLLSLPALLLLSFSAAAQIDPCFLNFDQARDISAAGVDQLPEASRGARPLKTLDGDSSVSVKDGYRILYKNAKGATFVNLKVELSEPGSYAADTTVLLKNFEYMLDASRNTDYDETISQINGFIVHGFSRVAIEEGSNLGTYAIFPGNDVIVYVYFQNITPEGRHFKNVKEYRKLRDRFLEEYLLHLQECLNR